MVHLCIRNRFADQCAVHQVGLEVLLSYDLPDDGILDRGEPLTDTVRNSEYRTIMSALDRSRNRDQAAEVLGISTRTLRHKLQRLREQGLSVTRAYAR